MIALSLLAVPLAICAAPPVDDVPGLVKRPSDLAAVLERGDSRNPGKVERIRERRALLRQLAAHSHGRATMASSDVEYAAKRAQELQLRGTEPVLVILVEFAGTDTFEWVPGVSTWDPLGRCDHTEYDGENVGNEAASAHFAVRHGISEPTNFVYSGPLHNAIERPRSHPDLPEGQIWRPDFSVHYYQSIIFGDGTAIDYVRQDGTRCYEDFSGHSVRDYYEDLSGGMYTFHGEVLGWVPVAHSMWWYGTDLLPGARSHGGFGGADAGSPSGARPRTLVVDAIESAKLRYPDFDWYRYDQDGDSYIDHLWIIHAGHGEESHPKLLGRTAYGEAALWSRASGMLAHTVVPGLRVNRFILMPEDSGIAVLAHEFGHALGAGDLYAYGDGNTSAGFWTVMADSWTGYPLGFLPSAMDPMHLDWWGWLDPLVIDDPTRAYRVRLGQASLFPEESNVWRAVRIDLENPGDTTAGSSEAVLSASIARTPQSLPSEHAYYCQWRNVNTNGGYDRSLGDSRFRFGPANGGLLVWYYNTTYSHNEVAYTLQDPPSWGPKGLMLVVDAHPDPYVDPLRAGQWGNNESAHLWSRGSMRDAAFSRSQTEDFSIWPPYAASNCTLFGRQGVRLFSDAEGYYPGLQRVGPPEQSNNWCTVQWDCSVVVPSLTPYGAKGVGYPASNDLTYVVMERAYEGEHLTWRFETNSVPEGATMDGGSGNPSAVGGQYGWNVFVVYETDTWAEVAIWNTRYTHLDDDGDRFPNWAEAVAGTDPGDPSSRLAFCGIHRRFGDSTVVVQWESQSNRAYRVLGATDLLSQSYETLATNRAATPPMNAWTNATHAAPVKFYRVQVE